MMILHGFLMDKHAAEISTWTQAGACGYGLEMEERGQYRQGVPLGLHGQGRFFWNQGQTLLVHTMVGAMLFQHKEGF